MTEPADAQGNMFTGMDAATAADPRSMYQALRDNAPVLSIPGAVVVSRWAEVDHVLHEPAQFSSSMAAIDLQNKRPLIPLQIDPPDHRRYRRILDPLFAPKAMALIEPEVRNLVNELIDGFIDDGYVDFSARFSTPYPSQVFLTMFGLPMDQLPKFLAMKDGVIRPEHIVGTEFGSPAAITHQRATAESIYDYFEEVLDERAAEPRDDLLSTFLSTEIDGERLSREDILDICFLFLIAGLDTVTATLSCMFAYLANHPPQRQKLVDDPSRIPDAIEEMLRWETPVLVIARAAVEDTEIAGCPVAKGNHVVVMLGSANLDTDAFPDADQVKFDRASKRHLTFGLGAHRCLGSHLARLELRVALTEWHRRIPNYSVEPGYELIYTPNIRTIDYFPMRFATG